MKTSFNKDFGSFDGRTWLNCAHQGPLPNVSVESAKRALAMKIAPSLLTEDMFRKVPEGLKAALGRLLGLSPKDIILSNSTSYGLHLLANGFPWKKGDEVLLVEGDFPANILPWLGLQNRGVVIRFIEPEGSVPEAKEIRSCFSDKTKIFCTSWVNSFSGCAADISAIGQDCRAHGIFFALNGSQAIGTRPFPAEESCVDMVTSCGSKWLCGPYATGFCWMRPELLKILDYNQAYWLAMQKGKSLNQMREYTLCENLGAEAYDVFGMANFFNFMPWTASVDYLSRQKIETICRYDQELVSRFIEGLDLEEYGLISPVEGLTRSTLIVLTHKNPESNKKIYDRLKGERIDISLREGNLRISPHLYNTPDDIDHMLSVLSSL
jgi:cysteine desulfurase/selenocysteine lyase